MGRRRAAESAVPGEGGPSSPLPAAPWRREEEQEPERRKGLRAGAWRAAGGKPGLEGRGRGVPGPLAPTARGTGPPFLPGGRLAALLWGRDPGRRRSPGLRTHGLSTWQLALSRV